MKIPRYKPFIDKSVSAALSAIEIYNKPDFKYREETFAILMINSWELLLKAKIISASKNNLKSIYVLTNKIGKKGNKLSTLTPKLNRSNNPMTIGLEKCLDVCQQNLNCLDTACYENIILLMEIRDAAIHFHNHDLYLSKKVFEIGTASLKNYLTLIREWFDYDLSVYNFYLMPISFYHEFEAAKSFSVHKEKEQIKNLLQFISDKEEQNPSDEEKPYNISLRLETKFVKSSSTDSLLIAYSNDPNALPVKIQEEDMLKRYPLDYDTLTDKLRARYSNFKLDKKYHRIRKELSKDKRFCKTRLLDPENPKSLKKDFFNSEILKEFDKHYKREN
jgi:hypothetical protein